ncbi:MAG: pyrimidine 5'-nucleotidase [Pseudomonadota bacterium]
MTAEPLPSAPGQPDLAHIRDWVFDLDNTLYPAECDLFAEIDARMTDFVARYLGVDAGAARRLQKRYYAEYGTTLKGLMTLHGMAPQAFLDHVHDIDLSPLPVDRSLRRALERLPGRRFVYTNGSRRHAERVTRQMGLQGVFDGLFGIEEGAFHPKPDPRSYAAFCAAFDVAPEEAIFFEDLERNLKPAREMGFATVLVRSDAQWTAGEPAAARPAGRSHGQSPCADYVTDSLADFLQAVCPDP